MTLSQKFFNRKQPQQKVNHCSKTKRKGEKGKVKKIPKIEKPKVVGLRMPESQCTKTRSRGWQERRAVVLQTHFGPDQR